MDDDLYDIMLKKIQEHSIDDLYRGRPDAKMLAQMIDDLACFLKADKSWVNGLKTICIDYNGVLDTYTGWKGQSYIYSARHGAREFLQWLKMNDWTVVIFTSAHVGNVKKFLAENGMTQFVDRITNEKVPAVIYLDDRAICFEGNFNTVMARISHGFKPFWKTEDSHGD